MLLSLSLRGFYKNTFNDVLAFLQKQFLQPQTIGPVPSLRMSRYHHVRWNLTPSYASEDIVGGMKDQPLPVPDFLPVVNLVPDADLEAIPLPSRISQVKHIGKVHVEIWLSDNV